MIILDKFFEKKNESVNTFEKVRSMEFRFVGSTRACDIKLDYK